VFATSTLVSTPRFKATKWHWAGSVRLLLLFMLAAIAAFAVDPASLKPQGYVSDFAHVLDDQSRQALEAYCGRVEQATGVQMALVTIDSLDDQPIEDFTNTLFRKWGVGKKGANEGVLLLLSIKDHKDRVEVGYGLEPSLPDGFVGSVLRDMTPRLKAGDYGNALMEGAESMGSRIAAAKNVALNFALQRPHPAPEPRDTGSSFPWPLIVIGILFLVAIFSRRSGGRPGGGSGMGGLLTGMILGNMMGGGRSSRWGGGGFGGFDSGGGGGGGGFGGFGGGDSGGGGASGSW